MPFVLEVGMQPIGFLFSDLESSATIIRVEFVPQISMFAPLTDFWKIDHEILRVPDQTPRAEISVTRGALKSPAYHHRANVPIFPVLGVFQEFEVAVNFLAEWLPPLSRDAAGFNKNVPFNWN